MSDSDWSRFLAQAIEHLTELEEGKSSDLNRASIFFEQSPEVCGELREFLVNTIWEIDGDREGYHQTLMFLKSNPTKTMLLEHLNSPS